MQYSGKRPAQKSLLCEFRQKTAYKHIISSLRKVRHRTVISSASTAAIAERLWTLTSSEPSMR